MHIYQERFRKTSNTSTSKNRFFFKYSINKINGENCDRKVWKKQEILIYEEEKIYLSVNITKYVGGWL